MYQTVGKLVALALVAGIGAAVVIHAQRNLQNSDETAASSADASAARDNDPTADLFADDDSSLGRAEPDFALGDDEVIPADNKTRAGSRVEKKIVKTAGAGQDRASVPGSRAGLEPFEDDGNSDPFDSDAEDLDTRPVAKPARKAAQASRSPIDILDLDDEPGLAEAAEEDTTPRSRATPPARSRDAALVLDDPTADERASGPARPARRGGASAGPRLLGGSSEDSSEPASIESDLDTLPSDRDVEPDAEPRSAASRRDEDAAADEPDLTEPPRTLTDEPRMPRRRLELPTDLDDDPPATAAEPPAARFETTRDVTPRRSGLDSEDEPETIRAREPSPPPLLPDARPAELDRTIEIDDAAPVIDSTPVVATPRKAPSPRITIEKQAPATAVLGRPMVYHIHVKNIGKIPAHHVIIEDTVPSEFEIDGTIPQAVLKDEKLSWKLGTLPAGEEKKIAVRVIPRGEGTIGGVATVSFGGDGSGHHPHAPQLKFEVSAPHQAAVGNPVEFKFQVRNVGTVPAHNVTIRDVLPAGLKHPDGDDLEHNLGDLGPGMSKETNLVLTAATAGPTVNRVVVTADGDVAEEAEVQVEVVGPMLTVARQGPKRVFPDKSVTFSNTVTNPGTKPMTGVTVMEKLPAGMEYVSASDGGIYDQTKRSVFWQLKEMQAGESRTVLLTVKTTGRGAQISVVRAFDMYGSTGETTATTKISGAPALTIEFGDIPALVEPGETVRIPVRILNRGSDTANQVKATISIPGELEIISADGPTSYREQAGNRSAGARELHFAAIEKIEPKRDAVFELTLKASQTGTVRLDMQAVCDQLDEPIHRQEVMNIVTP